MKQRVTVLRVLLLVAVIVSFAACSGGSFSDPGQKVSGLPGGTSGTTNNPDDGNSDWSGGNSSVGCASLSAGTKCSAQSACSGNFLCLTGQGSDSNCTTGCSCQQ
jgi:hypothetical protein